MNEKFIKISTLNNDGRYKKYYNICFFISISDILKSYNVNISPRKLLKICKFKGKNGDMFDTDYHIDKNLLNILKILNIAIFIYPYCDKFRSINSQIYYKLCVENHKYTLIIPIVCYNNLHYEPIVNTNIPLIEEINAKNIYKNKYILCRYDTDRN
jgi:hypothetical protein